jgi:hypothetical protein
MKKFLFWWRRSKEEAKINGQIDEIVELARPDYLNRMRAFYRSIGLKRSPI